MRLHPPVPDVQHPGGHPGPLRAPHPLPRPHHVQPGRDHQRPAGEHCRELDGAAVQAAQRQAGSEGCGQAQSLLHATVQNRQREVP